MFVLACFDGGLVCGPIALIVALTSLFAWFRHRRSCCDHDHHKDEHEET